MKLSERNRLIERYHKVQLEILNLKGMDYTGGQESKDANANFKEAARRLEGAPMSMWTSWAVYLIKHVIAVETFVRTGRVESEGIEQQLHDIANYANIGLSMLREDATEVEIEGNIA